MTGIKSRWILIAAIVSRALTIGFVMATEAAVLLAATDPGGNSVQQSPPMPPGCRGGDPLAGVHHPGRIEVVKNCVAVTGTVVWARAFADGDYKFNLRLDPGDEHLLNDHNRRDQGGALVCEIIPADQPGCTPGERVKVPLGIFQRIEEWYNGPYDFGICSGAHIPMPQAGARVRVVGPHVIDHGHGWMEIHPVWSLEVLNPPPR
jgi:hypothetical protein